MQVICEGHGPRGAARELEKTERPEREGVSAKPPEGLSRLRRGSWGFMFKTVGHWLGDPLGMKTPGTPQFWHV